MPGALVPCEPERELGPPPVFVAIVTVTSWYPSLGSLSSLLRGNAHLKHLTGIRGFFIFIAFSSGTAYIP